MIKEATEKEEVKKRNEILNAKWPQGLKAAIAVGSKHFFILDELCDVCHPCSKCYETKIIHTQTSLLACINIE